VTERRKSRLRDPVQLGKLIVDIAAGQTEDREDVIVSTAAAAEATSHRRGRGRELGPGGYPAHAGQHTHRDNRPLRHCLEAARGCGARLVVNTAPFALGVELLVPLADVLVLNAGEVAGLSEATAPEAAAEAKPKACPAWTHGRRIDIGCQHVGRKRLLPVPERADPRGFGSVARDCRA
jgi:hypothetical protein